MSDRPDTTNPNLLNQDVIVAKDLKYDNRHPYTRATYHEFRNVPDAFTSGSTTHDHESTPYDTFEDTHVLLIVLYSCIRYTENIHVSNHFTNMLERATSDFMDPKSVRMGTKVDMMRNNISRDYHNILK